MEIAVEEYLRSRSNKEKRRPACAAFLYFLSTPRKTAGLPVDEWVFWSGIPLHGQAPQDLTVIRGYHGLARGASFSHLQRAPNFCDDLVERKI